MINGRKDEEERRPKQHEEEYRHGGPKAESYMEPILHVPVVEPQRSLALVADPEGVGRLVIRQVPHDEATERRVGRRCRGGRCGGGSGGSVQEAHDFQAGLVVRCGGVVTRYNKFRMRFLKVILQRNPHE